ncbi:MAG: pantetheine-phosphate adenylyltransferase [Phototrophicales bacterium]|nr:MAG: pantetheine-phosphate adenylyltransferase [Phototrophicales bacterium]
MKKAVFPGSFNPFHLGHLDILRRAARVFEQVIVAVYENPSKPLLFTVEERIELVRETVKDAQISNVQVASFRGLTVDYLKSVEAYVMIRGLRVFSDFEFEFRMALANQRLAPEIEIVNFMTGEQYIHISSTTVREIASLGGDVSSMVPPNVEAALRRRFADKTSLSTDM